MRMKSPVAKVVCAIYSFTSWMTSEGLMLQSEEHSLSGVTAMAARWTACRIVVIFSTPREAVKPHLTLKKLQLCIKSTDTDGELDMCDCGLLEGWSRRNNASHERSAIL